jgi:lambda repressor-like predicted transcriptional regulator
LDDPKTLGIVIRVTDRPPRFKHLDDRALRKAFLRARGRLPKAYDRWIGLVKRWDKSYGQQKARELVDRLVTAVGARPLGILDQMFDRLEQQISPHLPKRVRRLEYEYTRLTTNQYYLPQFRPIKTDTFREQVYAALAAGPKTMKELARMFGKPYGAIAYVGSRLRTDGQITTVYRGAQGMWARASAAPRFVPARDAIIAALNTGPQTVPALARATGKGTSTVKSALHRHLLPNGTVTRTQHGTYALAGTQPQYVSRNDAIIGALKRNGPMSFQDLIREIGITPMSLPQYLEVLRAKGKIIRTARGIYALPGSAPVFVPTSDAIIAALTKKPMKLGALIEHARKLANADKARGTIRSVLARLQRDGVVIQARKWGEYRLVRASRGAVRKSPAKSNRQSRRNLVM